MGLMAALQSDASLRTELDGIVAELAGGIGERHVGRPRALRQAEEFVRERLAESGFEVRRHPYALDGQEWSNLELEVVGGPRATEILVVGAHYDSVVGSPGANDNATGVAALVALARRLAPQRLHRTLRFVAFVNEEPPWFQTDDMGSVHYARRCRERGENLVGMISLETLGCYSDAPGSQHYPFPLGLLYPSTGNFIGLVSNLASRPFLQALARAFRASGDFPAQTASLPEALTGVGWSDQWSFWREGYPGVMVTDTAPFRYPHYHTAGDTVDKIDSVRFARVVEGLLGAVTQLASSEAA